ncbi:hypothetical protein ZIOFF_016325 [Zingiber officinale]|uniref:Uncharacterized protein n=1 Tax=Zingiber officinale TaxID=94328 RepID=A0A8J5I2J3_ZINOF|nr:hypothetical protein ZIOFF_016325 [Zingiber officinale]
MTAPSISCPIRPRGFSVSLSSDLPILHPLPFDHLTYAALVDPNDNSTIVFAIAKRFNLRPARLSDPSRSLAQEIIRCSTAAEHPFPSPLSTALRSSNCICQDEGPRRSHSPFHRPPCNPPHKPNAKAAHHVRLHDAAQPSQVPPRMNHLPRPRLESVAVCGPVLRPQEAGFAHCALLARSHCVWIGCIDVNEFLHLPANLTLNDHKSIVWPEALDPSLINLVLHFQLKVRMRYVNIDKELMVISHYKYQVWEVFEEKFHCRVATYVADWLNEENVGSKDQAPGLGTKIVEHLIG